MGEAEGSERDPMAVRGVVRSGDGVLEGRTSMGATRIINPLGARVKESSSKIGRRSR